MHTLRVDSPGRCFDESQRCNSRNVSSPRCTAQCCPEWPGYYCGRGYRTFRVASTLSSAFSFAAASFPAPAQPPRSSGRSSCAAPRLPCLRCPPSRETCMECTITHFNQAISTFCSTAPGSPVLRWAVYCRPVRSSAAQAVRMGVGLPHAEGLAALVHLAAECLLLV